MSKHAIIKRHGKFMVKGLNTGRILGRHKTYIEALNQLRAVERSMHESGRGSHRRREHSIWPKHVHHALT